ncbi:unnamed protein product [Aphanomyces euteiches]
MQLWTLVLVPLVAAAANGRDEGFKLKQYRLEDYMHLNDSHTETEAASISSVTQEWFEAQKVDHTDATNKAVWKQQYLVNDEFYGGPGSPVFLYISGDNSISNKWIQSTNAFVGQLAQENKAMMVALEHRYYGNSQPVPNWSTANLKFLTSEQALADIANFQDYFVQKKKLSTSSPWISFGGSYAGSLSAWLKLKYPTRFAGAVASSGPIQARADFSAYSDVVSNDIKLLGGSTTNSNDAATLKQLFNPCYTMRTDDDRAVMEYYLYLSIIGDAQYTPENFQSFCTAFLADSTLTPVQRLSRFFKSTGESCSYNSYSGYLANFGGTTIDQEGWSRQW